MVTPKYTTYVTVSFPPMIMDLLIRHCWQQGISKQDFIRSCVRFVLNDNGAQDIDIEQIKINEKHTNQDPKLV